ncbi:MAG: ABC transporter ATP-binding protein [Methanoregulaceae archaeon]|nr:ABC transporter ATP-binding protein [Methanoregulaceae archaeon]
MLSVSGISVAYAGLQVLWDVSFRVDAGEIVTLIGSNGAGKSSLVGAIFGLNLMKSGTISFEGKRLEGLPTHEIVRKGLALVPEKRELFPKMTVLENLELGAYSTGHLKNFTRIYDLFPVLKERETQLAGTLSGGEQQMLAIGRSLMAQPKMLVLDEPSLGLSPKLVMTVLGTLKRLNEEGLTILLVEQNVRHALEISRRAYVLENGRVIREGPADILLHDDQVREAYLGM